MRVCAALVAAGISAVLASGCVRFAASCESDADCGSGEFCSAKSGSCIARGDGGDGSTCTPTCPQHQECASATCVNRYAALEIVQPADGIGFAPNAQVSVTASLTLASGRTANPPETLPLEVTDPVGARQTVTLTRNGATFHGTVTLGTADGEYILSVSYAEASLSDQVTIVVDATAPEFTVTIAPAPARPPSDAGTLYFEPDAGFDTAYRRDEQATVLVASTASDVDPASVTASVTIGTTAPVDVPVTAAALGDCPGTGINYCGRAVIDLWAPTMNAFRETFTVSVSGSDTSGNEDAASAQGQVTRWKWRFTASATDAIKTSPAIATDGTVLVGTSSGSGASGSLIALNHDGRIRWARPIGAVIASPAVGAEDDGGTQLVYASANTAAGGTLYGLLISDGGTVAQPDGGHSLCTPSLGGSSEASIAISYTTLSGEVGEYETASTIFNAGPELLSVRPYGRMRCAGLLSEGAADFPLNVAASGSDAFVSDTTGTIRGFAMENTGWTVKPGWPVDVSLFGRALAISSTIVIGTGTGPGRGGAFAIPITGGSPSWVFPTKSAVSNAAIGDPAEIIAGQSDGTLLRVRVGADAGVNAADVGALSATPLIGERGWLYIATRTARKVSARPLVAPDAGAWEATLIGDIEASPNIDCARGPGPSGRPGTLYVATNAGVLHAIVVDSRGLDTVSPWPKYQHDPRNTGNAGTPMSEFECH